MAWWDDAVDRFNKHSERAKDFWDSPALGRWNSYSDFVASANELTDGWYGTVADALPVAGNIHRAVLGRDRTVDTLNNTGRSWSDVLGYNAGNTTGGTSAPLAGLKGKIEDGANDLFEFYAGHSDKMSDKMLHDLSHERFWFDTGVN